MREKTNWMGRVQLALAFAIVGCLVCAEPASGQRRGAHHAGHGLKHGVVVTALPSGNVRTTVAGVTYYYHDGVFYHHGSKGYIVVPAPIGAVVNALPPDTAKVAAGADTLTFFDGAFYHWDADKDAYVVVDPPDGSEVPWVPDGYTIADRDGVLYYVYGGVYYRPVLRGGKRVYVVGRTT